MLGAVGIAAAPAAGRTSHTATADTETRMAERAARHLAPRGIECLTMESPLDLVGHLGPGSERSKCCLGYGQRVAVVCEPVRLPVLRLGCAPQVDRCDALPLIEGRRRRLDSCSFLARECPCMAWSQHAAMRLRWALLVAILGGATLAPAIVAAQNAPAAGHELRFVDQAPLTV